MSVLFAVFAIITLLSAGITLQTPSPTNNPRVQQVADATQLGFSKLVAKFNAYTVQNTGGTPSGASPADQNALNSVASFRVYPPASSLTYSYTYNPSTTTAILCLSGTVPDATALSGFVNGATAAGAMVTSRIGSAATPQAADCLGSTPVPPAPTVYPATVAAALVVPNRTMNNLQLAIYPASVSLRAATGAGQGSAQTVTIWNTTKSTIASPVVSLTSFSPTSNNGAVGSFSQSNSCPSSLNPGAKCVISVTYAAAQAGSTTGALTITDSAFGSPHVVNLTGSTY